MFVELQDIEKVFGEGEARITALTGVSVALERGEYAAVFGPSGSGKSTLLNILAGLLHPTGGEVIIDGINLYNELGGDGLARFRCEYIGFVFQAFNLLPYLTAYENTVLPLAHLSLPRREKREMAERALSAMGLADRMAHLPSKLSGGQQQRVAIARAIVNDPLIIIADEPTGNLDQDTRNEVMALFAQLNDAGQTIIMVTHERQNLLDARKHIHIVDGKVLEESMA